MIGKQLSFFEYENSFLSEFVTPCIWNTKDFTTIYFYGYGINRRGQMRNLTTNKIIFGKRKDTAYVKTPYIRHGLYVDGKSYEVVLHRLVACTFIKCLDRETYNQVNHIDENKQNNHYTNLEWVTRSENIAAWWKNEDKNQLKLL